MQNSLFWQKIDEFIWALLASALVRDAEKVLNGLHLLSMGQILL